MYKVTNISKFPVIIDTFGANKPENLKQVSANATEILEISDLRVMELTPLYTNILKFEQYNG